MEEIIIAIEEPSVATNEQKYFNYREQHNRLKKAMANEFYLEAIFIEYVIRGIQTKNNRSLRFGKMGLILTSIIPDVC